MSYLPEAINWIDIETTGLDPERDQILEVALVVTPPVIQLGVLPSLGVLSLPVEHNIDGLSMPRKVWEMHERSGLLDAIDATKKPEGVRALSLVWLDLEMSKIVVPGAPIGGSSPHFDLGFIKRHLPMTAKRLGHRVVDVSTMLAMAEAAGIEIDPGPAPHRALPDIERSIRIAERFQSILIDRKKNA